MGRYDLIMIVMKKMNDIFYYYQIIYNSIKNILERLLDYANFLIDFSNFIFSIGMQIMLIQLSIQNVRMNGRSVGRSKGFVEIHQCVCVYVDVCVCACVYVEM